MRLRKNIGCLGLSNRVPRGPERGAALGVEARLGALRLGDGVAHEAARDTAQRPVAVIELSNQRRARGSGWAIGVWRVQQLEVHLAVDALETQRD